MPDGLGHYGPTGALMMIDRTTHRTPNSPNVIILAGPTGNLGGRICASLLQRGATVRALVRRGSPSAKADRLRAQQVEIVDVDYANPTELATGCRGGSCVVSALSGLREVIVDAQTALLDAAVKAGV